MLFFLAFLNVVKITIVILENTTGNVKENDFSRSNKDQHTTLILNLGLVSPSCNLAEMLGLE